MTSNIIFSPVTLATTEGLEDAKLVLADKIVLGILVHAETTDWYLHSGFGPCEAEGILFPDLGAAEAWVRERLECASCWAPTRPDPSRADAASRPLRILIVEDDSIHAIYLESYIHDLGYEIVETVASAPQAVAAAATHHPDLVFMDVRLADGTDGIMAAQTIYERFGIPSIFITGMTDPATRARIETVNPLELLSKPVNAAAIATALQKAAELRERNRLS